jgi:glyoxylase-like metal-dependent hydrolase (beta-lactamase superfamily II)
MIIESKGKIGEGLYAIGAPELPAYLLVGEKPVLFDAGMTFMGPLYWEGLKEHLGDAGRLQYLFLTHSHFDHSGAAPFLKRKIAGLQIGSHTLAAETFKKPNAVDLIRSLSRNCEKQYREMIGGENVLFDTLAVDIVLADGMEMDLGGGVSFKVIATPGHTKDSISFYIPRCKALITGEAVGVYDKNFTTHPEYLSSYNDYMASLEKLASLEIDILMMAHYYTLTGEDANGYIVKAIESARLFRARIEKYLQELNGDREAVVKKIYKEDYEDTGVIQQEVRPFLINLAAKVKVVAEKR